MGDRAEGLAGEVVDVEAVIDEYLTVVEELRRLQPAFVAVAKRYAEAQGLTREAWAEFGVPQEVLDQAGITWASAPTLRLVPR